MALTAPPTAPSRTMSQSTFDAAFAAYLAWMATHVTEENALVAALNSLAAGTAYAIPYTFSTATADADPGAGYLRLDNATQNAATTIRADLFGAGGADWTSVLDSLDASTSTVKGQIRLVKFGDPSKWLTYNMTARATPAGYRNLAVVCTGSSAASPFADGDSIVMKFTRTGDKGDKGDPGAAAATPALILLATLTPTAAANLDALNVFSATYDNYLIVLDGIKPSADDGLTMRLANAGAVDTGSNFQTGASTTTAVTLNAAVSLGGKGASGLINICNVNDTATLKAITWSVTAQGTGGISLASTSANGMAYVAANAVSGFRLYWSAASLFGARGKVRIYGYQN